MSVKGNTNAEKHGGRAAITAVHDGTEFTGLAIAKESEVVIELDTLGVEPIEQRAAVRLQTISDLFYDAIQAAAQRGDMEKINEYTKRFGWIQSKALVAWAAVKANRKQNRGQLANVLQAYSQDDSICPQEGQGATETQNAGETMGAE
jgi:hypothetical protein